MTAKEYLQQIYRADVHINILVRQKSDLQAQLYRGSGSIQIKERVQTSPDGDPYIRLIAKIDGIERKINQEIDQLVDLKQTIIKQITALDNPRHVEVLYDRYVLLMKWEEIYVVMGYSELSPCTRLHGRALRTFAKKFGLKNGPKKSI